MTAHENTHINENQRWPPPNWCCHLAAAGFIIIRHSSNRQIWGKQLSLKADICLFGMRMVKWKWNHFKNPINERRIHLEPRLRCYYNVLKWGGAKLKPGRFAHSTFRRTKVILPMGAHRSWLSSSSSLIFFHQQQQHGWGWFKPISQTERMIGVISASL